MIEFKFDIYSRSFSIFKKRNDNKKKWYIVYMWYDHKAKNAYASKLSKSYLKSDSINYITKDLFESAKKSLLKGCEIGKYTITSDKFVAKKDLESLWQIIYQLRDENK